MTRRSRQSLVDDQVGLLVKHFGVAPVRAALAKAANGAVTDSERQPRSRSSKPDRLANPTVTSMLELLRQEDEEKYRLLAGFYTQFKDKAVLAEAQDIRHFAQLIGRKRIGGKSRKDMAPRLMRFLMEQPTERLRADIKMAASISEQESQKGFSVITDKLLGEEIEKRSGDVSR
jgi:hypothetical protein